MIKIRTYSELIKLKTFEERFEYLKLDGVVGLDTFGYDRYLNQVFYRSIVWRNLRHQIIIRDSGCDLGILEREIFDKIFIHHLNPITKDQIEHNDISLLDPENLICCSFDTHNAIHYGDESLLVLDPIIRTKNDTIPWL